MRVDRNTTFREIFQFPAFSALVPYLIGNCEIPDPDWTLEEMQKHFPDWVPEVIGPGLERFACLAEGSPACGSEDAGESGIAYDIYSEEEMEKDPGLRTTKLFFMPGRPGMPYVVICPGGAYGAVCTLKEGFPTGAALNRLGYNAFVLCYRVMDEKNLRERRTEGILPLPQEDLAAAMRFIRAHAAEFRVPADRYAVAGFSSGGHLAGTWAIPELGAARYGIPAPEMLILVYPAMDPTRFAGEIEGLILDNMFGTGRSSIEVERWNVNRHITKAYPPVYLMHWLDDPLISVETSREMVRRLSACGGQYIYRELARGGHGFGPGNKETADIWLADAVRFWEKQEGISQE